MSVAFRTALDPSRVGPFGLLQPLADGLKLFLKEDIMPTSVYRPLYILAPVIALACALLSIAVVPFGANIQYRGVDLFQISDLNIGLLVILGVTSVGVYGIALSGWASNNKYSLLGSLRSSAQMVSYELALGLSLVGVVIRAGSLRLRDIVDVQATHGILSWNVFGGFQIVAFFIYLIAAYAETNRAPFDLRRSGERAHRRLPHRIQLHEVRDVLHGRVRQHDHRRLRGHAALLRRLDQPLRQPAAHSAQHRDPGTAADLLVCHQGFLLRLSLHLGARHDTTFSLRPVDGLRLEVPCAARNRQHHRRRSDLCTTMKERDGDLL